MAFRWRADDGSTLNAGLVAVWFFRASGPVLLRYPIFVVFFQRGLGPPVPLSGFVHEVDVFPRFLYHCDSIRAITLEDSCFILSLLYFPIYM